MEEDIYKEIEEVRKIFLNEVDEEDYEENLQTIINWENDLRECESFGGWVEHEVTQKIIDKLKLSYKELGYALAENRGMTDLERKSVHAKQDAIVWMLGIVYKDTKSIVESIRGDLKRLIKVT